MELNFILKKLNIEDYKEVFEYEWNNSNALYDSPEDMLSENYVSEVANIAGLDHEVMKKLKDVAAEISENLILKRLFLHAHYLFFISENVPDNLRAKFPDMISVMGDNGPVFLFLLLLSGIPSAKDFFKSRGIPNDVARGAFIDISLWIDNFRRNKGLIGITPRILNWGRCLLMGNVYRLGRLQFGIAPFHGRLYVYRNKITNAVQALAEGNLTFNSNGQFDGVDEQYDPNTWKSVLSKDNGKITGNPVSSSGFVRSERISFDLNEWKEALAPGDPVLNTHIPGGVPMTAEACADSFRRALEFFPKYFTDKDFKGWACHSWLLDNQYEQILPEKSNIIKFQREWYLYPTSSSGAESYRLIFGENGIKNGIKQVPRNSSMQKAVAEFIEKGGKLRSGGGFFLKDEMPYGNQAYIPDNSLDKSLEMREKILLTY